MLAEQVMKRVVQQEDFTHMQILGQFNLGFIITKIDSHLFIIDQHATDEKYRFEMLQQSTCIKQQPLFAPMKLDTTAANEVTIMANLDIFRANGFEILCEETEISSRLRLKSMPFSKSTQFGMDDIVELCGLLNETPGVMTRLPKITKMFASRACRSAVMIGTALSVSKMSQIVKNMALMQQPWNCPHGRPTMRHLFDMSLLADVCESSSLTASLMLGELFSLERLNDEFFRIGEKENMRRDVCSESSDDISILKKGEVKNDSETREAARRRAKSEIVIADAVAADNINCDGVDEIIVIDSDDEQEQSTNNASPPSSLPLLSSSFVVSDLVSESQPLPRISETSPFKENSELTTPLYVENKTFPPRSSPPAILLPDSITSLSSTFPPCSSSICKTPRSSFSSPRALSPLKAAKTSSNQSPSSKTRTKTVLLTQLWSKASSPAPHNSSVASPSSSPTTLSRSLSSSLPRTFSSPTANEASRSKSSVFSSPESASPTKSASSLAALFCSSLPSPLRLASSENTSPSKSHVSVTPHFPSSQLFQKTDGLPLRARSSASFLRDRTQKVSSGSWAPD